MEEMKEKSQHCAHIWKIYCLVSLPMGLDNKILLTLESLCIY